MKRALALLMAVMLTISALSVTVYAAEPLITSTTSATELKEGDTFTITLSLENYQPIQSGGIQFFYDSEIVEFVKGEWLVSGPILQSFDPAKNTGVFAYVSPTDINGGFVRLTMRVKDEVTKIGETEIRIEPQLKVGAENVEQQDSIDLIFQVSCNEHAYTELIPEIPAKCGVDGVKAHYECTMCKKLFNEQKGEVTAADLVIPALNHVPEEGWHSDEANHWKVCTNQGCTVIIEGTTAAHSFQWVIDKPATEDETGVKHEECTVCGYERNPNTEIPVLPHVHTGIEHHDKVAATCHSQGNVEYWTCSSDKCAGKYYADATCTTELASIVTEKDPNNHDGETEIRKQQAATCTEAGYTGDEVCTSCGEIVKQGTVINALGHKTEIQKQKDATCTEPGYTGDEVCTVCKETVKYGSVIEALGHNAEAHPAKDATCTDAGNIDYWYCGVCKTYFANKECTDKIDASKTVIDALGHKIEIQKQKEATCTEDGYTGDEFCTVCKETVKYGSVIEALGHKIEIQKQKEATCTEDGYTGDEFCTVCKQIVKQGSVIKAGHVPELQKQKEATCIAEGYTGDEVCGRCGEVLKKGTVIAKVDHTYQDGKCTVCGAADPDYSNPDTGDNASLALWTGLMAVVACGVMGATIYNRKKNHSR